MRRFFILVISAILTTAGSHEDTNIDELLSDSKELQNFVDCFLDKGPCNDIAASFKMDIPEVVFYACDKCTPDEKHIVNAFIAGFKKAKAYQEFVNKFDPEGKYVASLEEAVAQF